MFSLLKAEKWTLDMLFTRNGCERILVVSRRIKKIQRDWTKTSEWAQRDQHSELGNILEVYELKTRQADSVYCCIHPMCGAKSISGLAHGEDNSLVLKLLPRNAMALCHCKVAATKTAVKEFKRI